ncbi:MAG: ABC transporter ATP-binding protein, partial [Lachnospiraceae bacterium]|nr:ABC transporter ATP-binding protein [Lachnospiraceae bacterium]
MNSQRIERLQKKYGSMQAKAGQKEMSIGRMANRGAALSMSGKPKDTKTTVLRLVRYLAQERTLLFAALAAALLFTGATLATSYMLRPIINKYI